MARNQRGIISVMYQRQHQIAAAAKTMARVAGGSLANDISIEESSASAKIVSSVAYRKQQHNQ